MISATTTFRSLVIVAWFTGTICTVIPFVEGVSPSRYQINILVFFGLLNLIWSIGLFCYKRWARLLCLFGTVFVIIPIPGEPQSFSWLRRYFYDISVYASGGLIVMAFYSTVKDKFAAKNTEPAGGNAACVPASKA